MARRIAEWFSGRAPGAQGADWVETAAIVLNYRRPENISKVVGACNDAESIATVFVVDQADEGNRLDPNVYEPVCSYTRLPNVGACRRFSFAMETRFSNFLFVDDDMFLTPKQIDRLVSLGKRDPARAHGVWGQNAVRLDGRLALKGGIHERTTEVDVLNRVYCLTRGQIGGAIDISRELGFARWEDIGPIDDILVSVAGERRPICHDVGRLSVCPSSDEPGVAAWKSKDFLDVRVRMVEKLIDKGLWRWPIKEAGFRPVR